VITVSPMGRYYCERCDTRYDGGPGDCPGSCEEEPLLDLRNEEVILFMEEQDRKRFVKRAGLITAAVTVLTSPLLILIGMFKVRLAFFVWLGAVAAIATPLSWALRPRPRTPNPATIS